jgi:predicted RNA-binding Zn ribbon-like protein
MSSVSTESRIVGPGFLFIGEHPAIDFANTLMIGPEGEPENLLRSWTYVVDWLSRASLSKDPRLNVPVSRGPEALQDVLVLRKTWIAVLTELLAGGTVNDEFPEFVNRLLAEDRYCDVLQRDGKKSFRLVRSLSQLAGGKLALSLLARQIATFLAEANLKYLHQCANTLSCTLYFYDTTKNHRRQWCRAAVCGNRHKVAAFRERKARTTRQTKETGVRRQESAGK